MLSRKTKHTLLKIISMFSVIRGYNIAIIVLAQYLSAIFILAPEKRALSVILDPKLFLIILASSLTIASGYIINNFYDSKKDLINRPNKSMLDRLVSQKTKLTTYFVLNFIVAIIAFFASWRACLFFSVYIFLIWYYSHRIKKQLFIGNIMAAILAVLPFFAILLYFKNFYDVIFFHATFLLILILIREIVKDLENVAGDLANNYHTIPAVYGEKTAKIAITILLISTLFPIYFLVNQYDLGYMDIYFYVGMIVMIFFIQKLWKSNQKTDYNQLHNLLKFIIVAGIFSIILIDPSVLWHGEKLLQKL